MANLNLYADSNNVYRNNAYKFIFDNDSEENSYKFIFDNDSEENTRKQIEKFLEYGFNISLYTKMRIVFILKYVQI